MGKYEIIDMALQLKAAERYEVIEQIMQSLDKSDAEIDRIWAEEALHRTRACDEGRINSFIRGCFWRQMMRIRFSESANNELTD